MVQTMTRRLFLISYFLFLISYFTFSQTDSCHVRISLLTCSPGEELYSTFGHSALRVTDSVSNEDIVYNYGTFNFDEPGFYTKFIRGKLMYYLSTEDFISFKQSYQQEKRTMIEQVLNLTCNEKQKMVQQLQQNLQGENKFYKYDFLFDNCTTRLRDLLEKSADSTVRFAKVVKEKTRFRQLIHEYLNKGDEQWSKLGIDLLLGAKTDVIMNERDVMFLPDYLLKGFDSARIGNRPAVVSKSNVYDLQPEKVQKNFFISPFFIFSLLLAVIIFMSSSKNNSFQKFLYGFDGFIFFMAGFSGLLILFMWFCTDHVMCRNNYNLLWALPTHAVMAFFIHGKKGWARKYFIVTAVINSLVLIAWFFLPQQMNSAFIPIVLLLIVRSIAYGKQ
jgi:hypothetical protein